MAKNRSKRSHSGPAVVQQWSSSGPVGLQWGYSGKCSVGWVPGHVPWGGTRTHTTGYHWPTHCTRSSTGCSTHCLRGPAGFRQASFGYNVVAKIPLLVKTWKPLKTTTLTHFWHFGKTRHFGKTGPGLRLVFGSFG